MALKTADPTVADVMVPAPVSACPRCGCKKFWATLTDKGLNSFPRDEVGNRLIPDHWYDAQTCDDCRLVIGHENPDRG